MPPDIPAYRRALAWAYLKYGPAALEKGALSESHPVRDAGQAAPDPCAVRAETRSTAGATSYAPTAGKGPAR